MTPEQEKKVLGVQRMARYLAFNLYPNGPLDRDDLAQAGLLKLCLSIDKFDESRPEPFSAWAGRVMRYAMLAELKRMTWRKDAKDLGRTLENYDDFDHLSDNNFVSPVFGDSGTYPEPRLPVERVRPIPGPPLSCKACAGPIPEGRTGRGGPPKTCSEACVRKRVDQRRTMRRQMARLENLTSDQKAALLGL